MYRAQHRYQDHGDSRAGERFPQADEHLSTGYDAFLWMTRAATSCDASSPAVLLLPLCFVSSQQEVGLPAKAQPEIFHLSDRHYSDFRSFVPVRVLVYHGDHGIDFSQICIFEKANLHEGISTTQQKLSGLILKTTSDNSPLQEGS
ncbi:hypothetical protein CHS0354_009555 [Potamilus streckersoni]|uniref:Uncharacterized protein n=1 Tax=Potamilus streckersoni TaxID=2493646 RepID=A0AAE0SPE1_9BIVA|nr:hypothetical protein CHS0354_009555 [Potamilus streckersoni]